MKALSSPFLLCASGLLCGGLLGWIQPQPGPVSAPVASGPAPLAAKISGNPAPTKPSKSASTRVGLSSQGYLQYFLKLEKATADEVATMIAAQGYGSARSAELELLTARFLKFPARDRLAALLKAQDSSGSTYGGPMPDYLSQTLGEMIVVDPAGVAAWLNKTRNNYSSVDGLLEPLLKQSGWEATQAFLEKLTPKARQQMEAPALVLLATLDFAKAQEICLKMPEGAQRDSVLAKLAESMPQDDPAAVLDWLAKHESQTEDAYGKVSPSRGYFNKLFAKDPAKYGDLLIAHQNLYSGDYGPSSLGDLFQSWAGKNYQEAADWLTAHTLKDTLHQTAVDSICRARLGSLKGAEALKFFETLPEQLRGRLDGELLGAVGVEGLPGGFQNYVKKLPGNLEYDFIRALETQTEKLTESDILAILPKLTSDSGSQLGKKLLERLSPEAQKQFNGAVSPTVRAVSNIQAAETALDQDDLEKAKSLLTANPEKNSFSYARLAVKLGQDNPEAATTWIQTLPDSPSKSDAITNLATNWAKADLAAATDWVQGLPAGADQDKARRKLATYHALSGDSQTAINLAKSISKESDRLRALSDATRLMWFQNPTAAKAVFNSLGLTAEQTSKVEKDIQKGFPLR